MLFNRKITGIAALVLGLLTLLSLYHWFSKEIAIYENADVDGYGFTATVTCRPEEGFTYYPYLVIRSPRGIEVSRSQLGSQGYETLTECRVSFPVERLELGSDRAVIKIYFNNRNAFGDLDVLDVRVNYHSPR
jgi:hypothetical protein